MQINLKHFLDFASHRNPGAVARAVITTAKIHSGKRRMGDATTDLASQLTGGGTPDLSYLTDGSVNVTSLVTPDSIMGQPSAGVTALAASTSFLPDGTVNPMANAVAVNTASNTADSSSPWVTMFNSLTSAVPSLLTAYTANQSLTACNQANQQRLSQGLAPVDCSSFAPQAAIGLTPATSSMLWILGGGALLLMFMGSRRKAA